MAAVRALEVVKRADDVQVMHMSLTPPHLCMFSIDSMTAE
jgi:hypothetical protein